MHLKICPRTARQCENTGCIGPVCAFDPPQTYTLVGWKCPNCGAGCAPNVETCPQCRPMFPTTSYGAGLQG